MGSIRSELRAGEADVEGIYGWIRSLAGYFLFVTVLEQLLPGKKYGKYVRLFSGMVLILLVVQPLTDKEKLEAQIARGYEALVFQYEAGDLREEILGVEHKRLEQMIRQYEEAVAIDIRRMAEADGVSVADCQVSICSDQESEDFGTVTRVRLRVYGEDGDMEGGNGGRGQQGGENAERGGENAERYSEHAERGGEAAGTGTSGAGQAVSISPVEPVEIDAGGIAKQDGRGAEPVRGREHAGMDTEGAADGIGGTAALEQEASASVSPGSAVMYGLRKRIAAYYNLEEGYVEIQIMEGQG